MFLVGELAAVVRADPAQFRRDMATVRREGDQSARQVNRSLDGVGSNLMRLGMLAKAAFSSAIVIGARQAVREFALLEGATAKFNVVFGEQSREMEQWVETVRQRVPLATREIIQNTSALQDLLVPMGIARGEATAMTQEWFELAAALSAFNDVPVEQALQAIQSAIAGQSRPLRQFGIDVRETVLQQVALEEGLMQSGDAMDENVRQQALLIQAYRNSQDAVDGYEDQLGSTLMLEQELSATFRDKAAEIGQILQPAYNALIEQITSMLNATSNLRDEFEGLRVIFTELPGPIRSVVNNLNEYIEAIRWLEQNTAIGAMRNLSNWFRENLRSIGQASNNMKELTEEVKNFSNVEIPQTELINVGLEGSDVENVRNISTAISELKPKIDAIVDLQIIDPVEEQRLRQLREEFVQFENTLHDIATMADEDFSHRLFPPGSIGAIREEIANLENQLESATDEQRIERLNARIRELQEELQRLGQLGVTEDIEEMSDASRLFTRTLADGLNQVLFQARSVSDALDGIIRQLGSRALIAGLASLFGGGAVSFGAAFFGGFRQSGGSVTAGRGYVVGESGPELFVPDSGGAVVSNAQLSGNDQHIYIHVRGETVQRGDAMVDVFEEVIRKRGRLQ